MPSMVPGCGGNKRSLLAAALARASSERHCRATAAVSGDCLFTCFCWCFVWAGSTAARSHRLTPNLVHRALAHAGTLAVTFPSGGRCMAGQRCGGVSRVALCLVFDPRQRPARANVHR